MTEKELMTIKSLSKIELTKKFYEFWTMKESIYKMGIFPNLTLESIDALEVKKKGIRTHSFYIDPYHPVTICWSGKQTSIKKIVLTRDMIMD